MVTESEQSSDAVDQLIRGLIVAGREPTRPERRQILDRIAGALFSRVMVEVPRQHRNLLVPGHPIGGRAPSLEYHRAKHTADGQWAASTTTHQYLGDLRRGVRHRSAEFTAYRSGNRSMAAIRVRTEDAVPPVRRGRRTQPNLVILYSADWGRILTGFQYRRLEQTDIPTGALWWTR